MPTKIDFAALAKPFTDDELEWRIQTSGEKDGKPWAIIVPYVQNRAIMNRLDEVVGVANWQNKNTPYQDGVICSLSIRISIPNGGEWVTKEDGAPYTQIEPFKGGNSDAMKRAAVQWGIGRYLYTIPRQFAMIHDNGKNYCKPKTGAPFRWDAPSLDTTARKPSTDPADKVRDDQVEQIRLEIDAASDMNELKAVHEKWEQIVSTWGSDWRARFKKQLNAKKREIVATPEERAA